jgi:hemolysin activation/secretion protein
MRFPIATFLPGPNGWFGPAIFTSVFAMAAMVAFGQPSGNGAGASNPSPIQGVDKLQGIVIVEKNEDVVDTGVTGVKGVEVKGPEFLKHKGFEAMLAKSLGRPMTDAALKELQAEILGYCKAQGHIIVDVITPEQRIVNGTVQIAVIEGRIEKIEFEHEGHSWFSDSILKRGVHLATNGVVQGKRLDSDLNWLNNNTYQSLGWDDFGGSFRQVDSSFSRGTGDWTTDVKLQEKDRFPLRVFAGGDNYGIPVLGENQLFTGLDWANVFGLDQRANYEYVTDTTFDKLHLHTAGYVIPLPGRQQLSLFGTYAELNPDFAEINSSVRNLTEKGTYYQASGRYTLSLPMIGKYEHQISAGFDFKRTDTPLLFGGSPSGQSNTVDVEQFTLAYNGSVRDAWGSTAFSLQGFYSPGGALETQFANNAGYNQFRVGTKVPYAYGRGELHRETMLPLTLPTKGGVPEPFTWVLRGSGQYADGRLLPTEQFGLGGYDTVRGYNERVVDGDDGWLVVNEIRTPHITLGNLTSQEGAKDWVQGLIFCDYGRAYDRQPSAVLEESYQETMLSVGLGLRYAVADNLSVRLDYGVQLDRHYATAAPNATSLGPQPRDRLNLGVELSF